MTDINISDRDAVTYLHDILVTENGSQRPPTHEMLTIHMLAEQHDLRPSEADYIVETYATVEDDKFSNPCVTGIAEEYHHLITDADTPATTTTDTADATDAGMNFECTTHGKLDTVTLRGYSIGHDTERLTEHDLEGITFTIENPAGDELTADHITSGTDRYLKKFNEPYQEIAAAIKSGGDAIDLGISCPECGMPDSVQLNRPT